MNMKKHVPLLAIFDKVETVKSYVVIAYYVYNGRNKLKVDYRIFMLK
jgi:hypothetical protein